jgi:hypothetical protein
MMKTVVSTKTPGGGALADAAPNFSLGTSKNSITPAKAGAQSISSI